MEIREHRLSSFIELYEKEFGVVLTREEAYGKATFLLQYTRLFMKPLAKANENDINAMSNINL